MADYFGPSLLMKNHTHQNVWDKAKEAFIPEFHNVLITIVSLLFIVLACTTRPTRSKKTSAAKRDGGRKGGSSSINAYEDEDEGGSAESQALLLGAVAADGTRTDADAARAGGRFLDIDPDDVGLGTPSAILTSILNVKLFAQQTIFFYLLAILHLVLVVFEFNFFVGEAFGPWKTSANHTAAGGGGGAAPSTWHAKMAATSQLLFWMLSLLFLIYGRLVCKKPLSGMLELGWLLQMVATGIKYYDWEREQPEAHSGPLDLHGMHWTSLSIVFGCSIGVGVLAVLDIFASRRLPFWEINTEVGLLESSRSLVKVWVDAGKYAEAGEDAAKAAAKRKEKAEKDKDKPKEQDKDKAAAAAAALKEEEAEEAVPHAYAKSWDDMTLVERSYASDKFVKVGLTKGQTLKLLYRMVMHVDAPLMAVGVVGSILNAIGQSMVPLAIGKMAAVIASAMIPGADKQELLRQLAEEGNDILLLLGLIGRFLFNGFVEVSGSRVICRVQRLAYASMLQQESAYFDKNKVGELTSLLSTNPAMMRSGMTTGLATTVGGIVQLILVIVFMNHQAAGNAGVDMAGGVAAESGLLVGVDRHQDHHHSAAHHLFGITMGTGSPCLLSFMVMFSAMSYFAKKQTEVSQLANGVATENLAAITTVAAYSMELKAEHAYNVHVNRVLKLGIQKDFVQAFCSVVLWWSWLGTQAGIYFFGGRMTIRGELTFEFLISYAGLFNQMLMALLQIFGAIPGLGSAVGSATKVFGIMIRHPAVQAHVGVVPASCDGAITFRDVDFTYPTRTKQPIFSKLNFSALPGKSVALAGESGCGKSSILRLLQRNYEQSAGLIELDGIDIRQLNVAWLKSQIGVVSQEPVLFSGTIEENIKAGRKGITKDAVVEAAKLADAHGFIIAMADGYDTLILEGGSSLSGGQKQRVAIARAVIGNPKVLIFDEATSALDRKAAAEIQRAITSVSVGRTTFTVAHNVAAIKHADVIHVIDDNTIVESGSHDELSQKQDSTFNRIFSDLQ